MATTLINAISDIPASPTAGDIIRFGTAITSGIPNKVKKANGTTRETIIIVGSEYRYIGTNWMKIGGDEIETTPLKDITTLAESEFETMIMGAVHNAQNSGRLRKFGLSLLHQALLEVNPLSFELERETLYDNTITVDGTYIFDNSRNINDYLFLEFETLNGVVGGASTVYYIITTKNKWKRTSSTSFLRIHENTGATTSELYYVSDTSFYIDKSTSGNPDLKIYGYKPSISLEN